MPPAGSLECCRRATSGLSCLGDPGSASCWEPRTRQPGHFRSVLAGRWAALHQVPGSPQALTTTWPQNLLTVLFCPLNCLVTKLLFRFLMWVKCGASDDFFKKGTFQFSHAGEPLSNNEKPGGVTCVSWERSPRRL